MATVEEIKAAIVNLSDEDRVTVISWLARIDSQKWDEDIVRDFAPNGDGAKWLKEVDDEIDRRDFSPIGTDS